MTISKIKKNVFMCISIIALFSASAFAQNPHTGDTQKALQLYKEYKSLHQEIQKLESPVIQGNIELQGLVEKVNNLINEKWDKYAKDFNVDMNKLKTLEEKIQNKDITQEEKQKLMGEYKDQSHRFYKAKQATLANEKVAASQKELSEKIKEETIKSNPDSQAIYSKIEKLEEEIMNLKKKMD